MGKTGIIITIILFNILFFAFIVAIVIYVFQYKKKKKEYLDAIIIQNELHQKEVLHAQIEIQSQTMQHIGREIHDEIGQHLTLASIFVQKINDKNESLMFTQELNEVNDIINLSLSKLRELSKSLTDDSIEKFSIVELIENECSKVKKVKHIATSFTFEGGPFHLVYQEKNILVRIIQEFIQNSLKHSHCKLIRIELKRLSEKLQLFISDDGIGFNVSDVKDSGIGLINIKKRIEILKGEYSFESNQNGTKLEIQIPYSYEN